MASPKPTDTLAWATAVGAQVATPAQYASLSSVGYSPTNNPPAIIENYRFKTQGAWFSFVSERFFATGPSNENFVVRSPLNEGGSLTITTANSTGTTAGSVRLASGTSSSKGGSILIQPQIASEVPAPVFTGGDVTISGGSNGTSSGTTGNVTITSLAAPNGTSGNVFITGGTVRVSENGNLRVFIQSRYVSFNDAHLVLAGATPIVITCVNSVNAYRGVSPRVINLGDPVVLAQSNGTGTNPIDRVVFPMTSFLPSLFRYEYFGVSQTSAYPGQQVEVAISGVAVAYAARESGTALVSAFAGDYVSPASVATGIRTPHLVAEPRPSSASIGRVVGRVTPNLSHVLLTRSLITVS